MHIINPYRFGASSTLLDGLVSWWSMDETSGSRADSHGSNTLTDNNAVSYTAGKQGNAATGCSAANFFYNASSDFAFSSSFTCCLWFYSGTLQSNTGIISKGQDNSGGSFTLWQSSNALRIQVKNTANGSNDAVWSPAISANTWYFVRFYYDAAANRIGLSINNGTAVTTAFSGTFGVSNVKRLVIGCYGSTGGFASHATAKIDETAFWSRILTTDETAELFASGSGMGYPG